MNQGQKLSDILFHEIPELCLKYMGNDVKKTYEELISEIKKYGFAGVCVQVLTVVLQKLIQVPAKRVVLALVPIAAQLQGNPVIEELPEDIKQKVENLKERVDEAIKETAKLQEEIKDLLQIVTVGIKAGNPVLIDERRLSHVDYYIDCCNSYAERASEAYKEVESALQDRLFGLGVLSVGSIATVVGGAVGAIAAVFYGLTAWAAAGVAAGVAAGAAAGTGAGAAAGTAAGTGAGAAAGTGAGAAGGTAAGAAAGTSTGSIVLAATGTGVGLGAVAVGGYACYKLRRDFCNSGALLQQVKMECGKELQKLKAGLEDIKRDAKEVNRQANK